MDPSSAAATRRGRPATPDPTTVGHPQARGSWGLVQGGSPRIQSEPCGRPGVLVGRNPRVALVSNTARAARQPRKGQYWAKFAPAAFEHRKEARETAGFKSGVGARLGSDLGRTRPPEASFASSGRTAAGPRRSRADCPRCPAKVGLDLTSPGPGWKFSVHPAPGNDA